MVNAFNKNLLHLDKCNYLSKSGSAADKVNWKVDCGGKIFFVQPFRNSVKSTISELIGSKIAREILGSHRADDVYIMEREGGNFFCASQEIPNFSTINIFGRLSGFIKDYYHVKLSSAFAPLKPNEITNPDFIFAPNNKKVKSFEDVLLTEAFVSHGDAHAMNIGIIPAANSEEVELAVIDFDHSNLKNNKAQGYKGLWNSYKYSLNIEKLAGTIDTISALNIPTLVSDIFKKYLYETNILSDKELREQEKSIVSIFEARKKDFITLKQRLMAVKKLVDDRNVDINSLLQNLGISIDQDLLEDIVGIKYYSLFDLSIVLDRTEIFNKFLPQIPGSKLGISLNKALELNKPKMVKQMLKKDISIFDLAVALQKTKGTQQKNLLEEAINNLKGDVSAVTKAGFLLLSSKDVGSKFIENKAISSYAISQNLSGDFASMFGYLINAAINNKSGVAVLDNVLNTIKGSSGLEKQFTEVFSQKEAAISASPNMKDILARFKENNLFTMKKEFASNNDMFSSALTDKVALHNKGFVQKKSFQDFLNILAAKGMSCEEKSCQKALESFKSIAGAGSLRKILHQCKTSILDTSEHNTDNDACYVAITQLLGASSDQIE